ISTRSPRCTVRLTRSRFCWSSPTHMRPADVARHSTLPTPVATLSALGGMASYGVTKIRPSGPVDSVEAHDASPVRTHTSTSTPRHIMTCLRHLELERPTQGSWYQNGREHQRDSGPPLPRAAARQRDPPHTHAVKNAATKSKKSCESTTPSRLKSPVPP